MRGTGTKVHTIVYPPCPASQPKLFSKYMQNEWNLIDSYFFVFHLVVSSPNLRTRPHNFLLIPGRCNVIAPAVSNKQAELYAIGGEICYKWKELPILFHEVLSDCVMFPPLHHPPPCIRSNYCPGLICSHLSCGSYSRTVSILQQSRVWPWHIYTMEYYSAIKKMKLSYL